MAVENINPEKEPIPKSWVPQVITGGKGPSDEPPRGDWLSELPVGCTFVAAKPQDEEYELFHVQYSAEGVVLLSWRLIDGRVLDRHVDPVIFSRTHSKYKILGLQPVDEENEDEQRNHSGHGDVDLSASVSGKHQVVQVPEGPEVPA